jgi:hypothetical protein
VVEVKSDDEKYYHCLDPTSCGGDAEDLVGKSAGEDYNGVYNRTIMQWTNSKSTDGKIFRDTETNDITIISCEVD